MKRKKSKNQDWEFNFVAESVSQKSAEKLLNLIIFIVEEDGGFVGGGFHKYDDEVGKRE